MTVCPVTAILDSEDSLTTMSARVAAKLQEKFPDVNIVRLVGSSQQVRVADGNVLQVIKKTCPVEIALHTSGRRVMIDPCLFAVMPGTDEVVILECHILQALRIGVYDTR